MQKVKKLTEDQKEKLQEVFYGQLVFSKTGVITLKRSYFYRMGYSPEKLVASVLDILPGSEILDSGDKWQAWPKDSYFWVKFIPGEIPSVL